MQDLGIFILNIKEEYCPQELFSLCSRTHVLLGMKLTVYDINISLIGLA